MLPFSSVFLLFCRVQSVQPFSRLLREHSGRTSLSLYLLGREGVVLAAEELAHELVDKGDGNAGQGPPRHLGDHVRHPPGALQDHTGGPVQHGIEDGLEERERERERERGVGWTISRIKIFYSISFVHS